MQSSNTLRSTEDPSQPSKNLPLSLPTTESPSNRVLDTSTGHTGSSYPLEPTGSNLRISNDPLSTRIVKEDITLVIKEKYLHPDSFLVTIAGTDELVFHVKGKLVSWSGSKKMRDVNGSHIFSMSVDTASTYLSMYLRDLRDNSIYSLRKKGFLPGFGRGTILVWKGKDMAGEPSFEITSNGKRQDATVVDRASGTTMASIKRKLFGARRLVTGLDTYVLTVNAGNDAALVTMLAVCFDEQYTEGLA